MNFFTYLLMDFHSFIQCSSLIDTGYITILFLSNIAKFYPVLGTSVQTSSHDRKPVHRLSVIDSFFFFC